MMELTLNNINYYKSREKEKESEVEIMEKNLELKLNNKEEDLIDKISNFFNFKSKEEKTENRINTEIAIKEEKINRANAIYNVM